MTKDFSELNDIAKAKEANGIGLRIRKSLYDEDPTSIEQEYANSLNNMGNIESAEGRLDEALAYFTKAETIRVPLGEEVIVPLALTHLTTGRALFLQGHYEKARHRFEKAGEMFERKFGRDSHFMAQ